MAGFLIFPKRINGRSIVFFYNKQSVHFEKLSFDGSFSDKIGQNIIIQISATVFHASNNADSLQLNKKI